MNGRVTIQIQYLRSSLFKIVNPCTKIPVPLKQANRLESTNEKVSKNKGDEQC